MKRNMQLMEETYTDSVNHEEVIGVTIIVDGDTRVVFDKIIEIKKDYSSYVDLVLNALVKGSSILLRGTSIDIMEDELVNFETDEKVQGVRIMIDKNFKMKLDGEKDESSSYANEIGEIVGNGITQIISEIK